MDFRRVNTLREQPRALWEWCVERRARQAQDPVNVARDDAQVQNAANGAYTRIYTTLWSPQVGFHGVEALDGVLQMWM